MGDAARLEQGHETSDSRREWLVVDGRRAMRKPVATLRAPPRRGRPCRRADGKFDQSRYYWREMAKPDPALTPTSRADLEVVPGIGPGTIIAEKYRVLRVIGRGGMGVVLAASQLSLERTVAIKLIRNEWAEQSLAVERLLREAKAAASIQSEHVARVLDVGTLDSGVPFIVMEYLEGHDLDTLLRREGPLPASLAVDYLLQGCEAIAEAHRNGIVHRDLKPANVFIALGPGGTPTVKVVDFGISKIIGGATPESLTQPSRVVGSLFHMAPEQMRGRAVDARTDVWALGLLLFEMLTGKRPYRDAAWPDVCARVLSDAAGPFIVPGDDVPRDLSAVIQRCLERLPGSRYQNVAELAVALAPFGGQSSSISLDRIVRVATSTGSLAARNWTPLPPELSRAGSLREASRHTPIIPASDSEGPAATREPSTREPVVTSTVAPSPRQRLWLAAALGVAAGAAGIASWRLAGSVARPAPEPTLAVQPLSVAGDPDPIAPPAVETPEGAPVGSTPPAAGASSAPAEPRISVLHATGSVPSALPESSPPTQRPPPTKPGAAGPQAPRTPAPTATPATGASEISRDDGALTEPTPGASDAPHAAGENGVSGSSAPAGTPPGSGAPTAPSGAPPAESPAPAPVPARPPKTPDAWDLSDIEFKSAPGHSP
jgi:serine/threonine protein kinase